MESEREGCHREFSRLTGSISAEERKREGGREELKE